MTIRRFLCLALGAGFLASCDLLDQDSGPKVAGTRLDIRHSARIDLPFVQADQTLQLAVPKEIPNWYQVGQNTKHVTGHIAFGGDWIKAWSVDIGEGISDGFALLAPPVASRDALYVMMQLLKYHVLILMAAKYGHVHWSRRTKKFMGYQVGVWHLPTQL